MINSINAWEQHKTADSFFSCHCHDNLPAIRRLAELLGSLPAMFETMQWTVVWLRSSIAWNSREHAVISTSPTGSGGVQYVTGKSGRCDQLHRMVGAGRPTAAQVNTAVSWSNTTAFSTSSVIVGLTASRDRRTVNIFHVRGKLTGRCNNG